VIWVALLADTAVALTKFAAAMLSGSAAMFAESLHSVADASSQGLLLLGRRLGHIPADADHPFGYGKERFFWPFIVSLTIFSVGGVFSIWRGLRQIMDPQPLSHLSWTFAVLGAALVLDALSWFVARDALKRSAPHKPIWQAIRESKTPAIITVFLEDTAGIAGIALAGAGLVLVRWLDLPIIDGFTSLAIGLLLFVVAWIIATETKSLLIGESASRESLDRIRAVVSETPEVERMISMLTMQLSPDEILVNLDLEFRAGLKTEEIEAVIDRIEGGIRAGVPAASRIFIEVESRSREKPRGPGSP
jgi:cation diffusion facilitator family transporter